MYEDVKATLEGVPCMVQIVIEGEVEYGIHRPSNVLQYLILLLDC